MIGAIILQVILIALNAVFTCAETAIVSLNDNQLEEMAKKDEAKAALLSGFKAKQERFLTAMQLVSMASVCLGSAYAALVFRKPLEDFIGKSGLVSEQSLAPIPIKEENEKKPDVILFGGNLFGRHTNEVTIDKTLASIKKMKAALGIYMVEGSADSALVEEKKEKISGAGVHLLLDESAVLHNGLQLVGCRADGKTKKPMSYT